MDTFVFSDGLSRSYPVDIIVMLDDPGKRVPFGTFWNAFMDLINAVLSHRSLDSVWRRDADEMVRMLNGALSRIHVVAASGNRVTALRYVVSSDGGVNFEPVLEANHIHFNAPLDRAATSTGVPSQDKDDNEEFIFV